MCAFVYLKVSNVAAVSPLELVYIDWHRVGSECVYSELNTLQNSPNMVGMTSKHLEWWVWVLSSSVRG